MLKTERLNKASILLEFSPSYSCKILHAILGRLCALPTGRFVLSHGPGQPAVHCYRSLDSPGIAGMDAASMPLGAAGFPAQAASEAVAAQWSS